METETEATVCAFAWGLDNVEQLQALADGMSPWIVQTIEHLCDLDDEHGGTHLCTCGASS
jgi:hypothetical protein